MRLWELEGGDGADIGAGNAGPAPWEVEDEDSDESEDEEEEIAPVRPVQQNWEEEDDSEDEEPAPDQRRPNRPHIEIVNFAANGVNRQIEIPENARRPPAPAPAPAPVPVGRRNGPRRAPQPGIRNGRIHPPGDVRVPPPAPVAPVGRVAQNAQPPVDHDEAEAVRVPAAPGQGNNGDAALQRFLQLALQDREDEWDSDEDDMPNEPVVGRPRRDRRRL